MMGRLLGRSGATAPAAAGVAQEGVAATRTASGAEGSFTTTTITFPASAQPTFLEISVSAASAIAQVATRGTRVAPVTVQSANPPRIIDLSMLPRGSTIDIDTEATAALVIAMLAHYRD